MAALIVHEILVFLLHALLHLLEPLLWSHLHQRKPIGQGVQLIRHFIKDRHGLRRMRVGAGRQPIENPDVRIRMVRQKISAHVRQRRDFAMKLRELLHHILPIDVGDEFERLTLVFGAAGNHQHVAIAICDILKIRIVARKGCRARFARHFGLIFVDKVRKKSPLLLHRHLAGEE